jgi:hypothetical protein
MENYALALNMHLLMKFLEFGLEIRFFNSIGHFFSWSFCFPHRPRVTIVQFQSIIDDINREEGMMTSSCSRIQRFLKFSTFKLIFKRWRFENFQNIQKIKK